MLLNVSTLSQGKLLAGYLPHYFSLNEGIVLVASKQEGAGYVLLSQAESSVNIGYGSESDLMMALGDLVVGDTIPDGETATVPIEFRGLMVDCSRNAVLTVDFLKGAILKLSLLGLNHLCLYTEDTYEVSREPLIGWGRGRYSKDEIRELDQFAQQFGVTLFPCIQTLGHFEQVFKYAKYHDLRDGPRVINARLEKSYGFLEKLIREASEPYSSDLIHLGMDEPWGIGMGNAFDWNSLMRPGEVYARHTGRVMEICGKLGLQGMFWADYVLGESGEKALEPAELAFMPKTLQAVYWNYDGLPAEEYVRHIETCRKLGFEPMIAPGLWSWNRYFGDFSLARKSIEPFMDAAHTTGCRRALLTMWGDDGHECLFGTNWLSLSLFLSNCRHQEPEDDHWQKRVELLAPHSAKSLMLLDAVETPDIAELKAEAGTQSVAKILFYDDPLFAYAGRMYHDFRVEEFYTDLAEMLIKASRDGNHVFKLASLYACVIAGKFALRRSLQLAYENEDLKRLKELDGEFPELLDLLDSFHSGYRQAWLSERKAFGLEVVDTRIAGLRSRVDILRETLGRYLSGDIERIPEFDVAVPDEVTLQDFSCHSKIYTRCWNAIW